MGEDELREAIRLLVEVVRDLANASHDHDYEGGRYIGVDTADDPRLIRLLALVTETAE